MDNDSSLKTDRTYRRQVRERYYRREEDFATLDEYNDYLEEVRASSRACDSFGARATAPPPPAPRACRSRT